MPLGLRYACTASKIRQTFEHEDIDSDVKPHFQPSIFLLAKQTMLRNRMAGRFRRRSLALVLFCLILGGILFYQLNDITQLALDFRLDFSINGFGAHDYYNRDKLHYSNYRYSLADKFAENVGGWSSFDGIQNREDKCQKFFDFLDKEKPDWEIPQLREAVHDKHAVKKAKFFADGYTKVRKEKNKNDVHDPENINNEDSLRVNEEFIQRVNQTIDTEQEMADIMTVIRVFGQCFYSPDQDRGSQNTHRELFQKFNRKVLPFFHNVLPHFETPDGQYFNDRFPDARPFNDQEDTLLLYYHDNLKGKGIVISASTRYARDIARLIRVLRALNNKLPIQIVHRGDLLVRARRVIFGAAIANTTELMSPHFTDKYLAKRAIPEVNLSNPEQYGIELPIQHLTFVNAQEPLRRVSRLDFAGYNNKIIAYFFNTFEEMILLDADAVPLMEPREILKLKEYTSTGAYFFKDRSLRDSNDWIETNFFLKLMPHELSQFDKAFGVRPITQHTQNVPYLRGWRHAQEAGLLSVNRRQHFAASLFLFPLAFWRDPIKSSIWGDKEMYWLSMSMAGDELYTLNKYGAASVGSITENPAQKMYNGTNAPSEVCSTHPGHINEEGKLIWINSGFSFCKKNGYYRDSHIFPFSALDNKEFLRKMYEDPLRIKDAVVPPELPSLRPVGNPVDILLETKLALEMKNRKKDVDDLDEINQIEAYLPQKGWIKSNCCTLYYYCAFNAIESYEKPGTVDDSGRVFTYEENDRTKFDYLGKIWITGIKSSMNFELPVPSIEDYPRYTD